MNAPIVPVSPVSETFTFFVQTVPQATLPLGPLDLIPVIQNGLTRSMPGSVLSQLGLTFITNNYTVGLTDQTIEANAAGGSITILFPLNIGSPTASHVVRIVKIDGTINPVLISDGTTIVDSIATPATSTGQIGGFRQVYSNGANLRSFGVG